MDESSYNSLIIILYYKIFAVYINSAILIFLYFLNPNFGVLVLNHVGSTCFFKYFDPEYQDLLVLQDAKITVRLTFINNTKSCFRGFIVGDGRGGDAFT